MITRDACNDLCMTFYLSCFRQSIRLRPAAQLVTIPHGRDMTRHDGSFTAHPLIDGDGMLLFAAITFTQWEAAF